MTGMLTSNTHTLQEDNDNFHFENIFSEGNSLSAQSNAIFIAEEEKSPEDEVDEVEFQIQDKATEKKGMKFTRILCLRFAVVISLMATCAAVGTITFLLLRQSEINNYLLQYGKKKCCESTAFFWLKLG